MKDCGIDKLRGRTAGVIQTESCRRSAVCVPLISEETTDSPLLLFEVRSSKIKTQPGDVCFPGGHMEEGETAEETAIRETCEELLLKIGQIRPVCPLDVFCDGCMMISPVLARLEAYRGTYSSQEVSEVFTVPLSWFMDHEPERHTLELVHLKSETFPYELINGGENYHFRRRFDDELFYRCKSTDGRDRIIWGLTARIIKSLTDTLK